MPLISISMMSCVTQSGHTVLPEVPPEIFLKSLIGVAPCSCSSIKLTLSGASSCSSSRFFSRRLPASAVCFSASASASLARSRAAFLSVEAVLVASFRLRGRQHLLRRAQLRFR